jgi:autotransporter-associated beta strand protein
MNTTSQFLRFVAGCSVLLGSILTSRADTFVWTGPDEGNWNDPAHWNPGVPVGSDITVLEFNTPADFTTTHDIPGGIALNRLVIGADAGGLSLEGNSLMFGGVNPAILNQATSGRINLSTPLALGTSTLTLQSEPGFGSQLDLLGPISGSGGITIASGAVGIAANVSNFTGETRILAGAIAGPLGIGTGQIGADSPIIVEEGARFQFGRFETVVTDAKTLTNAVSLGGTLESRTRDYSAFGVFLPGGIQQGAITLTSDTAEILAFQGGTEKPEDAVNFILTGPVDRAGHTLTVSTTGAGNGVRIEGSVSGDGNLTLNPSGGSIALTGGLSGTGRLDFLAEGGSASISGPVSVAGDVLVSGSGSGAFQLSSLAGDGRLEVGYESAGIDRRLRILGPVSGAREVRVTGGELQFLNPFNSFAGSIDISGSGFIRADRSSSLGQPSNALDFQNGGGLEFTNNSFVEPLTRDISTTNGIASIGFRGNAMTIGSTITGSGGIALGNNFRAATAILSGANDFEGGLVVGPNIQLLFSHDGNLGATGGFVRLAGSGAFSTPSIAIPAGYGPFYRPLQLAGNESTGGGNLSIAAGETLLISGDVSGTGVLGLGGAGTYILSGTNTHLGGVALSGNRNNPAVLVLDSDARLGAATSFLNIGQQSGSVAHSGLLRAADDLEIAATRNTNFRLMTVDTAGFDVVFNQPIAGRGMTKTGEGTWTLATANTDTSGDNNVNLLQGTLRIGTDNALGTRATIDQMAFGSALDLDGQHLRVERMSNAASGSEIRLGNGGSLQVSTSALFLGSRITGSGSLVLGAEGIASQGFSFDGNSDFTGSVTVQHGANLLALNSSALGAAGNSLTLDNGTLSVSSLSPTPLVIDSSSNLIIGPGGGGFQASGQSIVISSPLGGSHPLRFSGGNSPGEGSTYDVRLLHPSNSFVGDITLGDASLVLPAVLGISADGSLGHAGNTLTLGSSFFDGERTLAVQGGLRAYADLDLPVSREIRLDGSRESFENHGGWIDTQEHTVTVRGGISEISQEIPLLKTGSGNLVIEGTTTYSGVTTIAEGGLLVQGEISLSDISVLPGAHIGGGGIVGGGLSLEPGAKFLFSLTETLTVNGSAVSFGGFGIQDVLGLDPTTPVGTYTLIDGAAFIDVSNLSNLGAANAFDLGGGKSAYFSTGSLMLHVIPEPSSAALFAIALLAAGSLRTRRRRE